MVERDLYEWSQQARSVWFVLGNSRWAAKQDFTPVRDHPWPHYNPPNTLSDDESPLILPAVGQQITFSVELACRIGVQGENVVAADAEKLMQDYHIFIAVRDNSYIKYARKCSNFPSFGKGDDETKDYDYEVTHGWADGFAQLSKASVAASQGFPSDRAMRMSIDGCDPVETNTNAYVHHIPAVIEVITPFVCVEDGDVISLGTAGPKIVLEPDQKLPEGAKLTASIEGLGEMIIPIIDQRSDDNYYARCYQAGEMGGFI